jgi:hypothetical protein
MRIVPRFQNVRNKGFLPRILAVPSNDEIASNSSDPWNRSGLVNHKPVYNIRGLTSGQHPFLHAAANLTSNPINTPQNCIPIPAHSHNEHPACANKHRHTARPARCEKHNRKSATFPPLLNTAICLAHTQSGARPSPRTNATLRLHRIDCQYYLPLLHGSGITQCNSSRDMLYRDNFCARE